MFKYDYSLLRGRIREMFGSEKNFAEKLNESNIKMSSGCFNSKINGKSYFKQPEIEVICELLSIPINEVNTYFFTKKYELNS